MPGNIHRHFGRAVPRAPASGRGRLSHPHGSERVDSPVHDRKASLCDESPMVLLPSEAVTGRGTPPCEALRPHEVGCDRWGAVPETEVS